MAVSLTARSRLAFTSTHVKTTDLSAARDEVGLTIDMPFSAGTGNKQVDVVFHDKRTLGDGASEELDLNGVLEDTFGTSVAFVKVKAILIQNLDLVRTLTVGGAASNAWEAWCGAGDVVKVLPEGKFYLEAPNAGLTVTPATGDLLKIANEAGGSSDYNLWIIGTSA